MFFFFFQAEDGIRDVAVTGVQTCALPISLFPNWSLITPFCSVSLKGKYWSSWVTSARPFPMKRSEEHTSELQSRLHLVCRLLLEKKKKSAISSIALWKKGSRSEVCRRDQH